MALLKDIRCSGGKEIDGHPRSDVRGFFTHIALADLHVAEQRERLLRIPTDLDLPAEDIDQLIAAGERETRESEALKEFSDNLQ